jgi:tetratricopeptide (TPR) repeat protein
MSEMFKLTFFSAAYVNAGQLLTRLGRINQAMDMYRKCFNLNDDGVKDLRTHVEAKVSALLRFGKLLIEIEDAPKAAINVYRQAVRIMPSDYEQKQVIVKLLFKIYSNNSFLLLD